MARRFALLLFICWTATASADIYQDAVNDPARPGSDREDDDRRKPAEVMAWSGVSRGNIVIEIGAGRGYTTELAARIVGPDGKIYADRLDPARLLGNRLPNVAAIPNEPANPAVRLHQAGVTRGGADRVLAFFSLHDAYLASADEPQQWYEAILDYLRPGGEFVVMDNSAPAGSGLKYTADVHRIDPEFLRREIIAAGFEFVAASNLLRNPDDNLESSWFEATETRKAGYQDRFAFRFRKP